MEAGHWCNCVLDAAKAAAAAMAAAKTAAKGYCCSRV